MKKFKNLLALISLATVSNVLHSQNCGITISNNTNCTAHGYIEWYDCSSAVCDYQPFTEIAGSVNSPYTCSGCATVCDVKFVLQDLGGSIPSWPFVNSSSSTNSGASPCVPATFNLNLNVSTSHLDISP
jgi:hypothetical protein